MAASRYRLLGIGLTTVAAVAFSAKALVIKAAYAYPVDAVTLMTLRMGMALPFYLALAVWSGRDAALPPLERRDWARIAYLGFVGYYLASFLDFSGLRYISAGLERLILFLYPTLVMLLSMLFTGRRASARELAAMGVSYLGLTLAFVASLHGAGPSLARGAILVFLSALAFAVYLLGTDGLVARVGSSRFTAYAMLAASVPQFVHFGLTHPLRALDLPPAVYGWGVMLAVFSTVLPSLMLTEGIRRVGAGQAAILGAAGPVSVLIFGALWLHEPLGAGQVLGALCVIGGVLTLTLKPRRAAERPTAAARDPAVADES